MLEEIELRKLDQADLDLAAAVSDAGRLSDDLQQVRTERLALGEQLKAEVKRRMDAEDRAAEAMGEKVGMEERQKRLVAQNADLERQLHGLRQFVEKASQALQLHRPGSKVRIVEPGVQATVGHVLLDAGGPHYHVSWWIGNERCSMLASAHEIEAVDAEAPLEMVKYDWGK